MREDIPAKAKGNEAAVMVAKKCYEKALSGDVSYFAAVLCGKPNDFVFMCGGHGGMETTALGAAYLAGRAAGICPGPEGFAARWRLDRRFTPAMPEDERARKYAGWKDAVARTLTAR